MKINVLIIKVINNRVKLSKRCIIDQAMRKSCSKSQEEHDFRSFIAVNSRNCCDIAIFTCAAAHAPLRD